MALPLDNRMMRRSRTKSPESPHCVMDCIGSLEALLPTITKLQALARGFLCRRIPISVTANKRASRRISSITLATEWRSSLCSSSQCDTIQEDSFHKSGVVIRRRSSQIISSLDLASELEEWECEYYQEEPLKDPEHQLPTPDKPACLPTRKPSVTVSPIRHTTRRIFYILLIVIKINQCKLQDANLPWIHALITISLKERMIFP